MKKWYVFVCFGFLLFSCKEVIDEIDDGGQSYSVRFANVKKITTSVTAEAEKAIKESDFRIKAIYGAAGGSHRVKDAKRVEYTVTKLWDTYSFPTSADIYEIWYESSNSWLSFSFTDMIQHDSQVFQKSPEDLFIVIENTWYRPPMCPDYEKIEINDPFSEKQGVVILVEYTGLGKSRETSQTREFTELGEYLFPEGIDVYRISSLPEDRVMYIAHPDTKVLTLYFKSPTPP
jgi:hypothetical protein